MEIEKLLVQPESKVLEFKRDLSSMDPILKTIIAFANTAGGILIIGRSSDGILNGVQNIFKEEEMLASSIADNIRPSIMPDIEISTVNGKDLLVVKVSHWRAPFYLKMEGMPKGVYIRLGSSSRPASPELLSELQRSILTLSFDQEPINELKKDALQFDYTVERFKHHKKEISEQTLRTLNILVPHANTYVPSIGGLILFGKREFRERFVPHAQVRCARFLGKNKSNILDQYEVDGTILDAVDQVLKFISRNTRLAAEIKEIRRKDIPEYSPIAVREALINALVHTDYSMVGSDIQIAIFDDRLEILNPGMLPFGFTLDDFKAGVSRLRNRVIARVFHELKLMEKWGSGYKRIIDACRSDGYPEPKWEEFATFIRVTFYPHHQTSIVAEKKEPVDLENELTPREKVILRLFEKEKTLPFREIYANLSPKISERMLKYDLAELKKKGILVSHGKGRSVVWEKSVIY